MPTSRPRSWPVAAWPMPPNGRGLTTEVPACLGWRISELVAHTGGVHRWATSFVITGRTEPYPPHDEVPFFAAPTEGLLA